MRETGIGWAKRLNKVVWEEEAGISGWREGEDSETWVQGRLGLRQKSLN